MRVTLRSAVCRGPQDHHGVVSREDSGTQCRVALPAGGHGAWLGFHTPSHGFLPHAECGTLALRWAGVPTGTSLRGLCPACLSHAFWFWGFWDKVPHAVAFGSRLRRRTVWGLGLRVGLRAVGGPCPLPVGGRLLSVSSRLVPLCMSVAGAHPEGPRSNSMTSVKTRLQIRSHSEALGAGLPHVGPSSARDTAF